MSESEPITFAPRSASQSHTGDMNPTQVRHPPPSGRSAKRVFFDRRELSTILNLYGKMVASGEWRDYAISQSDDEVAFCVFRRTSEMALYRIVKAPRDARRQGAYRVIAASGAILKRGHDLAQVLKVLHKRKLSLVTP